MAPPRMPWFRFYAEACHDRKLRRLTPTQRWLWVAVLAAASQSPTRGILLVSEREPMAAEDLADLAAIPAKEVTAALPLFEKAGMLHQDSRLGAWCVTNWNERQFPSDSSTERSGKHRTMQRTRNNDATLHQRSVNGGCNETASRPESESDIDPPLVPPNTHADPAEHPQDGTRPTLNGKAQALVERWVSVSAAPAGLARAEAEIWIPHLLTLLDPLFVDECIGRCAIDSTRPPKRITYLASVVRDQARQRDPAIVIPDPPANLMQGRR